MTESSRNSRIKLKETPRVLAPITQSIKLIPTEPVAAKTPDGVENTGHQVNGCKRGLKN